MCDAAEIRIFPLIGLPEIQPGDDLGGLMAEALRAAHRPLVDFDVVVVAHKVVSKAEGKLLALTDVEPAAEVRDWAERSGRDPRVVQIALNEAASVLRMENGVLISQTRHGFICANSGVDTSNAPPGHVVLLPDDPDLSARGLREQLSAAFDADVAVIVTDTFGRPWREGLVNVAIGLAGFDPLVDYRGTPDAFGRMLRASVIAAADELASAAELVMKKARRVPVALVRGFRWEPSSAKGRDLLREPGKDLFR
jgi:coenzyme F420-0:L-glutamate ligase / coenzyme F420-1:gamma-L-glutamate ligase